jgi:hypothetical protein
LSGVSEKTIRRCEAVDGHPPVAEHSLMRIGCALTSHGVHFIEGQRRTAGPGIVIDWNPELGTRAEILALVDAEGEQRHDPKLEWPTPRPIQKPKC